MGRMLEVNNLSVYYDNLQAINNVSFSADEGKLIGIVGPNGAGKSTLIKAILGLEKSTNSGISAFEKSIKKARRQIAYVPQRSLIDWDFPVLVEDVVMMGRYIHLPWYKRPSKDDKNIVTEALEKVGMTEFRKRQIGELSGGQQQRVFIARALAQQATLFFLDEPFAGIDVTSEEIIINILKSLREENKTILVVHHDLSKVEEYFDQVMLVNKELIGYGEVSETFKPELLSQTYKGKIKLFKDNDQMMVVGN
ncbi:metal ABC transporter ATP-binding protein [Alkalihalobacterium chitinilyticum]|uniref:Metal ABC transporter ATP-binding protein n=1 Tax=Alkalihalobacterium chitinilyticum TaxID=2980103 RepID=A0ABT5VI58_9BACI|nr:metal ABC transporter ATP-binding protein [Alkalihalobacterium chitinilyticum]MDE5413924.1 metal ABC transporter ATP-binding protein [Alkalihalobacterium chitinilyticum]